jgi:hypothetical protein
MLCGCGAAKLLGHGATVDFGQFGQLDSTVEMVRVPELAVISVSQWCWPLRRQHWGRLLRAFAANRGAANGKPNSKTIVMARARRMHLTEYRIPKTEGGGHPVRRIGANSPRSRFQFGSLRFHYQASFSGRYSAKSSS